MPVPTGFRSTLPVAATLVFLGCAHATQREHTAMKPIGLFIDEARIQKSGAETAWEVLKREAPMLSFQDNRFGQPARFGRRGRSSILLSEPPLVFLDGVRMADFRVLDDLPAATLQDIWVLTGIEGTTYYGTDAVSGVVLVRTKQGSRP